MPYLRSRLAPTPSGYLHLGNLANFFLIEKLTREQNGKLLLRIDDCDGTRARPEFVEHIFSTLQWLGLSYDEGPRDPADFYQNFSQTKRKAHYFARLTPLRNKTYACECSRKEVGGVYPGTCREKKISFTPGKHALRLCVDDPLLAEKFGDVILWRKDDGPAYQWVSVIDDLERNVNLIVRGEDLRDSSDLQKYIASLVAPEGFARVRFIHHPLLRDEQGQKLSKTEKSQSVVDLMEQGISSKEVLATLAKMIEGWRV